MPLEIRWPLRGQEEAATGRDAVSHVVGVAMAGGDRVLSLQQQAGLRRAQEGVVHAHGVEVRAVILQAGPGPVKGARFGAVHEAAVEGQWGSWKVVLKSVRAEDGPAALRGVAGFWTGRRVDGLYERSWAGGADLADGLVELLSWTQDSAALVIVLVL